MPTILVPHVMQLKESLTVLQCSDHSISEYMQVVKATVDELALIDAPLSSDDITLYVLHGLGPEFRDVVALIHTRESALSFEELHDIFLSHEVYLKRLDVANQFVVVITNTIAVGMDSATSTTMALALIGLHLEHSLSSLLPMWAKP